MYIAIFVDTCTSWFLFDKRALGIWCNGIVPYKANEFLMHRAHTITVPSKLTRQHHKHFSSMLYLRMPPATDWQLWLAGL